MNIFSSLRTRLLLLVIIALIPFVILIISSNLRYRSNRETEIRQELSHYGRMTQSNLNGFFENTRKLLLTISSTEVVQRGSPSEISVSFEKLHRKFNDYINLGMADINGNIISSAIPMPKSINSSDLLWFRQAVKTREFSFGKYQMGRVVSVPVIVFSMPIPDDEGKIKGVLYLSISCEWFRKLVTDIGLPQGYAFSITDIDGTILSRYPDPEKWSGKQLKDSPIVVAMLNKQNLFVETEDLDGENRINYISAARYGDSILHYSIGISLETAFSEINRDLQINMAVLIFVGLFSLLAAFIVSEKFILRPVNALTIVAGSLSRGDFSVRTVQTGMSGELGQLAMTFDSMASALSKQMDEIRAGGEALRESEQLLKSIIEHLPVGVWYLNAKGEIIFGNPAGHRIWEGGRHVGIEQFGEYKGWLLKSGKQIEPHEWGAARAIENGEIELEEEIEIECFDGTRKIILNSALPLRGNSGEILGAISINEDITERKRAAEALADEKERLSVTLRSIGDGVITADTHGTVVLMNRVAEELCGWTLAEARGNPLSTVFVIIDQITRKPSENPVGKVLASGQNTELTKQTLLISRDGTERLISDSGAPIKDRNSLTIGVVLVFRDMTERQKLLDAAQRNDKLDALGVLAGGIAHDFNNLLAGIFGYIDLARSINTADDEVANCLDKAIAVFNRAKDLTQQLLTFSKGGAPVRKTGQLEPLLRKSVSFALSGSKIACEYSIAADLWSSCFDENQIGQVIDNLVINAKQAMPAGGKILVSAGNVIVKEGEKPGLSGGNFVRVSITDTGTGIQPYLLNRIFDPFFTTKLKGNGLGLATCYTIIHKHEGCIEVESVVDKGTTFHIFLPASPGEIVQGVDSSSVLHKGSGKMIIMDDEEYIREILGSMLGDMGYTVLKAKDGEEALKICAEAMGKSIRIEGAFLDITVPGGMGGKETIVQIRQRCPHMLVFASSGYSEDPVMSKPTGYGFTDSIRKPYRKEELAAMLNRHIK
ncbi:MAG: PAS domain S-box protein [Candidatus Riflebacteria bacterium]|nr:PAS domain S-box protein [Candidatus Riflebacteria bacterium]